VEKVIDLIEWQRDVRNVFWPKEYVCLMARIEGTIRDKMKERAEWCKSALYKSCRADKYSRAQWDRALLNLIESKEIMRTEGPSKGGRRPIIYKRGRLAV
jgi:hypothetical protein